MKHLLLIFLIVLFSCEKFEPATPVDGIILVFVSPDPDKAFEPGQNIEFEANVADEVVDIRKLKLRWISDVDGVLTTQNIPADGVCKYSSDNLSHDRHIITCEVFNEDNAIFSKSITIYNAIALTATATIHQVSVSWSTANVSDFISYKLYRSDNPFGIAAESNLILENTDVNATSFDDKTAILGKQVYYHVTVQRQGGLNFKSPSVPVIPGEPLVLNYPIKKVITDSVRNFAYAIIDPGNFSENRTGYGLTIIDLNDLSEKKRILTTLRFADLDMDPEGKYLFVGGDNTIHKIDLATLSVKQSITVNNRIQHLEVGSNNRLYYHVHYSASNYSNEFRIVDLLNKTELQHQYTGGIGNWGFYMGDCEIDATNNTIFHVSTLSSATLSKFTTTADIFSNLVNKDPNGYAEKLIYRNGLLFWDESVFDSDLNLLAGFENPPGSPVHIVDASPNGKLMLGFEHVFDVTTQSIKNAIPASYNFGSFIKNNDMVLIKVDNPNSRDYTSTIYYYRLP
jgi:hypothetical protein